MGWHGGVVIDNFHCDPIGKITQGIWLCSCTLTLTEGTQRRGARLSGAPDNRVNTIPETFPSMADLNNVSSVTDAVGGVLYALRLTGLTLCLLRSNGMVSMATVLYGGGI